MHLPQSDDWPCMSPIHVEFFQESRTIAFDRRAGVLFREPEIQSVPAVYARRAAHARRKAVNEPGQTAEPIIGKNSDFRFDRGRGWHANYLTKQVAGACRKGPARTPKKERRPADVTYPAEISLYRTSDRFLVA